MNRLFTGYQNSGKTSLAYLYASTLGRPFIDTDRLIRQFYHRDRLQHEWLSISHIYRVLGESYFRKIEQMVIQSIASSNRHDLVIALGGGALLSTVNQRYCRKLGRIIYLKADAATLFKRMQKVGRRPCFVKEPLTKSGLRQHLAKRDPIYQSLADQVINVNNKTPAQLLAWLLKHEKVYGE